MPSVGAQLTIGGGPGAASQDTASVSPTANALLLLDVIGANGGGGAPVAPTVSGNGLTWVQVTTVTFSDNETETWRVTRFRAQGASPSTGVITITHSTAPDSSMGWALREHTGVVTTGTNGSDAEVQTVTNTGTGTAVSATLAAFGSAGNGADALTTCFGSPTITPEAGWTGFTADTSGNTKRAQWRDDNDTTPSSTLSASQAWGMIATEIEAAAVGGGTTTMAADGATFSLTGADANLEAHRVLSADGAVLALTGTAANLEHNRRVSAESGTFALTGTDAALSYESVVLGTPGEYLLTGTDASLEYHRVLGADGATFALTGTDAALSRTRALAAESAAFALSGADTGLEAHRALGADNASFALTGADAALEFHRALSAEPGAFALTGTDVTLTVTGQTTLDAEPGSFALLGTDAALLFHRAVAAEGGAFDLNGADAGFLRAYVLEADGASFALTGADATLRFGGLEVEIIQRPPHVTNALTGFHVANARLRSD